MKIATIFAVAAFAAGAFFTPPVQQAIAAVIASDVQCTGCVGTSDVAGNAITAAKIKDGEVKAADLGSSAVTSAKLANNAVNSAKIADGTLLGSDASDSFMKRVTLLDGAPGWNPDDGEEIFGISDSFVVNIDNAIVLINLVKPSGAPPCMVVDLWFGGFTIQCERAVPNGTELHYLIINKPSSGTIS